MIARIWSLLRQWFSQKRTPIHRLVDVFTPSSSAKLTFVQRESLSDDIIRALHMPGMQLVIYGHSGSGKTTLVQNVLTGEGVKCIISNCIVNTTVDELILDAFDRLNPYYTSEDSSKIAEKYGADVKSSYLAIDATVKLETSREYSEKRVRLLPIQLTAQRLAEFLGSAEVIWILEDFHKVQPNERQKLSQILKVFVDTANRFPDVKIIAIGAVGTAREVVNWDRELDNRVTEIHVPLMTDDELKDILRKGEILLNVRFAEDVRQNVIGSSNSLAAICHHLCHSMCYNCGVKCTAPQWILITSDGFRDAVRDYLKANSDSLKETLDRALKPRSGVMDKTRGILLAFCEAQRDELTAEDVLAFRNNKSVYKASVGKYLELLCTAEYGEILRFDENAGKYSFSNPFFKAYARMHFTNEDGTPIFIRMDEAGWVEDVLRELRGYIAHGSNALTESTVSTKLIDSNAKDKKSNYEPTRRGRGRGRDRR